jgi:excisionase family DNA binding protein
VAAPTSGVSMSETNHERPLATVREIVKILRVDADTIYRAIRAGDLPAVRVGRQWRFDVEAVLARAKGAAR